MVLVELSVMEQRYDAVMAVIQDGWKIVEVAERLGLDTTLRCIDLKIQPLGGGL